MHLQGCDCLGTIKYFDGILTNTKGEPMVIKKAICMHEEDYGASGCICHTEHQTRPCDALMRCALAGSAATRVGTTSDSAAVTAGVVCSFAIS